MAKPKQEKQLLERLADDVNKAAGILDRVNDALMAEEYAAVDPSGMLPETIETLEGIEREMLKAAANQKAAIAKAGN